MSEFKTIETQEQFDTAIKERLQRERETVAKEYAGYLSPEDVQKKYTGYLSPEDAEKKYGGYLSPEEVAKKDATIKKYETNSVKMKIAHEVGIPFEIAERLSGEDEDAIRKDAEALHAIMGGQERRVPPLRNTEPNIGDEKEAAFKEMLNEMKGE